MAKGKARVPKFPKISAWVLINGIRYWLVVDGTFKNRKNAYNGAKQLRQEGYRARVVKYPSQIGTIWAVYYYNPSSWGRPRPRPGAR